LYAVRPREPARTQGRIAISGLSVVFVLKIGITLLFWCVPLLLFPSSWLAALGVPAEPGYLLLRLLGCAYLALLVGYSFGLRAALAGRRAAGPVWMGIVSNGGASLLLLGYGINGAWSAWGGLLNVGLWLSAAVTGGIALALLWWGVVRTD
jgi:hypothetical protein